MKKGAKAMVWLFNSPLHPILKGVASGGGLGTGLQLDVDNHSGFEGKVRGVVTVNGYWSTQADAGYYGDDGLIQVYARVRDMTQLNYFGPGTESVAANHTNFRLHDQVVGARALTDVLPWVSVGARVENYLPDVKAGRSTTLPSIAERFSEAVAPGLTAQPRFMRYEGMVNLTTPAGAGEAFYQGAKYRVTYSIFADQGAGNYDFRRMEFEAQQRFAIGGAHRRLTLHGWLSTTDTDAGDDVPFYLQRTLGGKSNLRTVDEDLIGSDDTQASLRGYRSYRFRDRHLMLLQAEYRIPLWGPFDATVFTEAGKVAPRLGDLDFSSLKTDYGFSLGMMQGRGSVLRLDVGFGSGEGVKLNFSLGKDILP